MLTFEAAPATGIATGETESPSYTYPPVEMDERYRHLLNFRVRFWLPPLMKPEPTHGPLILYGDNLETIVISPLDHFFISHVLFDPGGGKNGAGVVELGLIGDVVEIPEGFVHRFVKVEGKGIGDTGSEWGRQMLADRGRKPVDRYADVGLFYPGYWTNKGGYYNYKTE